MHIPFVACITIGNSTNDALLPQYLVSFGISYLPQLYFTSVFL